jgi:hypothetical protein
MNIIEALKSGKPFRRIGLKTWLVFEPDNNSVYTLENREEVVDFEVSDMLSEFELLPKRIS